MTQREAQNIRRELRYIVRHHACTSRWWEEALTQGDYIHPHHAGYVLTPRGIELLTEATL